MAGAHPFWIAVGDPVEGSEIGSLTAQSVMIILRAVQSQSLRRHRVRRIARRGIQK